jgi:alkylhydroperoxidase family enzyme
VTPSLRRAADISDAEIVETVANVGLSILTNYVNHVAQTVVDFPEVHPGVGEPP